jgi:hypothetical protein
MTTVLKSLSSSSNQDASKTEVDHRTKRLKPILQCLKDFVGFIKENSDATVAAKNLKKNKKLIDELSSTIKSLPQNNLNLVQFAESIILSFENSSTDHNSSSSPSKNFIGGDQGKKRKSIEQQPPVVSTEVSGVRDWKSEDQQVVKQKNKKKSKNN